MEVKLPRGPRVDVLGERGDERWGFEIQLSEQSWRRTAERTVGLARHGVRAVWLLGWTFRFLEDFPDLPVFTLARPGDWWHSGPRKTFLDKPSGREDVEKAEVLIGSHSLSIGSWLRAFLEGRIRHCNDSVFFDPTSAGELLIAEGRCSLCGQITLCLLVPTRLRSRCGVVSKTFLSSDLQEEIVSVLRDSGEFVEAVGTFEGGWREWPGACQSCQETSGGFARSKALDPACAIRPACLPRRYEKAVREDLAREVPRHWCLGGEFGWCSDFREDDRNRVAAELTRWVGERFEVVEEMEGSRNSVAPTLHRKLMVVRPGQSPAHVYCLGGPITSFVPVMQDHASRIEHAEAIWLTPGFDRVDQLPQKLRHRVVAAELRPGGIDIDGERIRQLLVGI